MTVFSLLCPDKRHIKASSDFHLSFLLFYRTFFSRKTLFLWIQAHRSTTRVQLPQTLFISSQMSGITGLDPAKRMIIGFCGDKTTVFGDVIVYGEIRKWSIFLGFRSFPKSFYSKTALILRIPKNWNNKIGLQKFFAIKQCFSRA